MKTKSGKSIFPIGIGTWGISSTVNPDHINEKYRGVEPFKGNEEHEIEALRYSISKGQNHIDCAEMYGGFYTDEVVGLAIEGTDREDLFIADKLWKTSVGKGKVRTTVELMLKKLGSTYLDLLYIHAPFDDAPWEEAIPQINELIDEGIVRYFGISNVTLPILNKTIAQSKHPVSAIQQRFNVLCKNETPKELRDFCTHRNIVIVAYHPVARQWTEDHPVIKKLADKYKVTTEQIALKWVITQPQTITIPKAINKDHIDANLAAMKIELTPEDIAVLDHTEDMEYSLTPKHGKRTLK